MKSVYQVESAVAPKEAKFKSFRHVMVNPKDFDLIREIESSPTADKARRLRLFYDNLRNPRRDLYYLHTPFQFICNQRARDVLATTSGLGACLFPISIEGESEPHYLLVVTRGGSFFDLTKSVWRHLPPDESDPDYQPEPSMAYNAFESSKLPGTGLFFDSSCFAQRTFCMRESTASGTRGFRTLVESNGLIGLNFELVWSERTGPILPDWGPIEPGEVWKTGDGRVVRENKDPIPKPKLSLAKKPAPVAKADDEPSRLTVYKA